jgi:hypothetical protein
MPDDPTPTERSEPQDEPRLPQLNSAAQEQTDNGSRSSGEAAYLPTKQELIARLNMLAGCVAMGTITPGRANSMRGIYATILGNLDDHRAVGAGSLGDQDVLTVLRDHPHMLKFLKPFLTPEQIDLIVREASNE